MTPYTLADAERDLAAALNDGDPDRIAAATARLDQLDTEQHATRPTPTLGASALWYAEQGLRVFPLRPGTKIPFKGTHGFKDATTDRDQITAWWIATPDANIGLATGHLVDVVDIDGPTGQTSRAHHWDGVFAQIDADNIGKVLTPRPGGMHIYVPATGAGNAAGIVPGVDIRGLGGYVLAPPSTITDAAAALFDNHHPGTYRWLGTPHLTGLPTTGSATGTAA